MKLPILTNDSIYKIFCEYINNTDTTSTSLPIYLLTNDGEVYICDGVDGDYYLALKDNGDGDVEYIATEDIYQGSYYLFSLCDNVVIENLKGTVMPVKVERSMCENFDEFMQRINLITKSYTEGFYILGHKNHKNIFTVYIGYNFSYIEI